MYCTINDVNLSFDKDNRLKSTISRLADGDANVLFTLSGYLTDEKFYKYLSENLLPENIIKGKTIDLQNINKEDLANINKNSLYYLLKQYLLKNYKSVNITKTRNGISRTLGFTSITAKYTAQNKVADLIFDIYKSKIATSNKSNVMLETINEVIDKVNDEFNNRADNFSIEIVNNTENYSKGAINVAKEIIDNLNELKRLQSIINNYSGQLNNFVKEKNELIVLFNQTKDANESKIIKEKIDNIDKQKSEMVNARDIEFDKFNELKVKRYILNQTLLKQFSSERNDLAGVRDYNYANLLSQLKENTNEFFYYVFSNKKMTEFTRQYEDIDDIAKNIEDMENEDGTDSMYNNETLDEMSKNWNDHAYKTLSHSISGDMKVLLSTVPKLSQPYNPKSENQSYDTNNELGVSTYMDSQFLTKQLFSSFIDYSSVESMVRTMEERSKNVIELYGLGELVSRLKKDPVLARFVWSNFAKPVINKIMCTINEYNKKGIKFNYSNTTAFDEKNLSFSLINSLRGTFLNNYDSLDEKFIIDMRESYIVTKRDVIPMYVHKENFDKTVNIIHKYFPKIETKHLELIYNKEDKTDFKQLLLRISEIIKFTDILNQRLSNHKKRVNEKYDKEYELYEKQIAKGIKVEPPVKDNYMEFASDLLPELNGACINIAKILNRNTPSAAKLVSKNAEGSSSADVGKNCYISRFFEQILSGNEADSNAGLNALGDYIMQGINDGISENQYSNNPLFFGLKDVTGKVIQEGLFTRKKNKAIPNHNAKVILNYALFDGNKDNQRGIGQGYAKMSNLDFMLSQFIAYNSIVIDYKIADTDTRNEIAQNTTMYSMRIGSDAPKIFMIQAPRYREPKLAIFNHLLDEFNMFINGINVLFKEENNEFVTKKDIDDLFGKAYFNEKTAANIREQNETDYTSALIENGKLVGNVFKFLRLFHLNNYNADKMIESKLQLYTGNNPLFQKTSDGRLKINFDRINSENSFIKFDKTNRKFILDFQQNHRQQLYDIVNEWSNEFLEEARPELTSFIDNVKALGLPSYDINNFLLSCVQMNMTFDDMFEGDFKFYKDSRDFFKRTKETQAGGDGYYGSSANIFDNGLQDTEFLGEKEAIKVKQTVGSEAVQLSVPTYNGRTVVNNVPMVARNGWRAVTIYNVVRPSDYAPQIKDELYKEFINQGFSNWNAYDRATKLAKAYFDATKVNDAQSYITFEEWIRRRYADGTIGKYQDLIAQILDPTISAEQINIDNINARIQVNKNFYYDKVYDAATNTFYPRQIKNAEFVIIPKLLPKDSDLVKMYDWMIKNDIGQVNTVETDKAAKKNIFTIFDEKTGELIKDFDKTFDDKYVQTYYYKYLYKQQDVPQHMKDERNKFNGPISKKILDNISNYPPEIQNAANDMQRALSENLKEDFVNFLDGMGWKVEDGKIVNKEYATKDSNGQPLPEYIIEQNKTNLNFDNFRQRARQEISRLGLDSNFYDYVTTNEFGQPNMPMVRNDVISKLESVAQSLFNSGITRQSLPGWHAAQVTDIGWSSSNKLKFDPVTGTMEIRVPRWSNIIPKGKNEEENRKIFEQIEKEGLNVQIIYRMPTEGKQSIAKAKIVGFVDECLGSTVLVPQEWVTITGSDFDVDSIYSVCWEMYRTTNKQGDVKLHKIKFKEEDYTNEQLYISYVNNRLEKSVKRDDLGNLIKTGVEEFKDRYNQELDEKREANSNEYIKLQQERKAAFKPLATAFKKIVNKLNKEATDNGNKKLKSNDIIRLYENINSEINKILSNPKLKIPEAARERANKYVDIQNTIIDILNAQNGLNTFDKDAYYTSKSEVIQEIISKSKIEYFEKIKEEAVKNEFLSFEEFCNLSFIEKLPRNARNNFILDKMIQIMNDHNSREEQYGRSQFEDITKANKTIDELYGLNDKINSPYNPVVQMQYMNDAMSGASLKARSVMHDTFMSKCNKLQVYIDNNIGVAVNTNNKPVEGGSVTYSKLSIVKSYGEYSLSDLPIYEKQNSIPITYDGVGEEIKNYTLYSGKQKDNSLTNGGDKIFNQIADEYGITDKQNYGPQDYNQLSEEELKIIEKAYKSALNRLQRPYYEPNSSTGKLHRRNYLQVRNTDAVFAIAPVVLRGELNSSGYKNNTGRDYVDGGTGYAVEYAIDLGKPVYVFDAAKKSWFTYNKTTNSFEKYNGVPKLTPKFTGVGSRKYEGNETAINAVKLLFRCAVNGYNTKLSKEVKDVIGIENAKTTLHTLETNNNLTAEEKAIIGKNMRVAVASEVTDPIFHCKKIAAAIRSDLAKPLAKRKYHAMYLITKHDGLPLRELLELDIPKYIHFSITSLGGTKWEKGVMKMDDMLDRIQDFIDEGLLSPSLVTIRIDPIIPGVTKKEDIRHIMERATKMGIKSFKFSLMDSYGNYQDRKIVDSMRDAGYEWEKYYDVTDKGKIAFNPKREFIEEYYKYMDDLCEEFDVKIHTCGENPTNLNLKRIKTNVGCINAETVRKITGVDFVEQKGHQRPDCSCMGNKSDMLKFSDNCSSACLYCYAKHNNDSVMQYYNEDGTLKDNAFTRTVRQENNQEDNIFKNNIPKEIFTPTHYGWSENNRNITGDLITSYSSETTAHQLDAIKEGSIPNINEYTFDVYKMLTAMGLDYETIISFMRQPVISMLVNNYSANNSLFSNTNDNPIYVTINEIANKLKYTIQTGKNVSSITKDTYIYKVLQEFINDRKFVSAFREIWGINDIEKIDAKTLLKSNTFIDKDNIFKRIKYNGEYNQYIAAFDLGNLIIFGKLFKQSKDMTAMTQFSHIDKVGAKTSLFETKQILRNIEKYRDNYLLTDKNGKSITNLLFPEYSLDSEYSPVTYAYNYSTKQSVDINSKLFKFENEEYDELRSAIETALNKNFNKEMSIELRKFIMSRIYNQIQLLVSPISLNEKNEIVQIESSDSEMFNQEITRIFGYGDLTIGNFECNDIYNPTKTELDEYVKLTPAQKVLYIQRTFIDDSGIFKLLNVSLFRNYDQSKLGTTRQYISFDEQNNNIEDVYNAFENAFNNNNPLIKLAAIDLVKYMFIVENSDFKYDYITKLVPNNILYNPISNGGLGLVYSDNGMVSQVDDFPSENIGNKEFIDDFVRSHSYIANAISLPKIPPITLDDNGDRVFKYQNTTSVFVKSADINGLVSLESNSENDNVKSLIDKLRLKYNNYINISFENDKGKLVNALYKVYTYPKETTNEKGEKIPYYKYYLAPLNKLESNEVSGISYNIFNNKYQPIEYYEAKIKESEFGIKSEVSKINIREIYDFNKSGLDKNQRILDSLQYSSDNNYAGGVQKLVNDIQEMAIETMSDEYQYTINNNYKLAKLFNFNTFYIQEIQDKNGDWHKVKIERTIFDKKRIKLVEEAKGYLDAIRDIESYNSPALLEAFYKEYKGYPEQILTLVKQLERYNKLDDIQGNTLYVFKVIDDADIKKAESDLVEDTFEEEKEKTTNFTVSSNNIDTVSANIIRGIQYEASKNKNKAAKLFISNINRIQATPNYRSSLTEHREDIYTYAARYYKSAANKILNQLNGYILDTEEFKMNDPQLYEKLKEHDEKFAEIANIILDAITFGNQISDIFNIDLAAETKETADAIISIRNSINLIKTNTIAQQAMANLINIYFKKYSTNPLVINDILEIREQYGDIDTAIGLIQGATEINNQEVQVILKHVYSMLAKAELFDAENNLKAHIEKMKEIDSMVGDCDMNKIINFDTGKMRPDYNGNFEKDKQKVIDDLNSAKFTRFDSVTDYKRYMYAQLTRDKFFYENMEQPIVDEYYKESIDNLETLFKANLDGIFEYFMLNSQLYTETFDEMDKESAEKKQLLLAKTKQLKKQYKGYINSYIKRRSEINKKYFNSQEYDGFQDIYVRYSKIVDRYNKLHKEETLEEKLENADYNEAYNWIKNNGHTSYTDEASELLEKAFKNLTGNSSYITPLLEARLKNIGAMDEAGNINVSALTEEQLQLLHDEQEFETSTIYDNGFGDSNLIKVIPDSIPVSANRKLDKKKLPELLELHKEKYELIGQINSIIGKCINKDTGKLDIDVLFNNNIVSDEERLKLISLYRDMKKIRLNEKGKIMTLVEKGIIPQYYDEKINYDGYYDAKNYYDRLPVNSRYRTQFMDIFTEIDATGNIVPNFDIFGYIQPKEEFVDKEFTESIKFIRDNLDFIETEEYYVSKRNAIEKGEYDKWFKLNHIYNPYSHKYEPLKIWRKMIPKPDSYLAKNIEYVPIFKNVEKSVKEEYINKNYSQFNTNYATRKGIYNTDIQLNEKEAEMKKYILEVCNKYATTYQGKKFIGQGYLPRERTKDVDLKTAFKIAGEFVGISINSGKDSDAFRDIVDYSHDKEADFDMLQLIKDKGSKQLLKYPDRNEFSSYEEYKKRVDEIRKENDEIRANNETIDAKYLNKNFREVLNDFVYNATIFNSRQAAKPYLYLLLEDLANNKAYMLKGMWNKQLIKDNRTGAKDDTKYKLEEQKNTRDLIHTLARRLIYGQYNEKTTARKVANLLQNMASAKYMITNLYGGIANVTTGHVNIKMEEAANEYFGFKDFTLAEKTYLAHAVEFVRYQFSDTASSLPVALCKQFNIVEMDSILKLSNDSDVTEHAKTMRNYLYSFQSAGEHYMQNSVLLAMCKSNRLFKNTLGKYVIGDFKDFTADLEQRAMLNVLGKYSDKEYLKKHYELYLSTELKYNLQEKLDVSTGRKDINRNYLKNLIGTEGTTFFKKLVKEYNAEKERLIGEEKTKFYTNPTVESMYEMKDGKAVVKPEYYEKMEAAKTDEEKINQLNYLLGGFKRKVIAVNHKIHGIYDRNDAAKIESKWWGSLIMQFHKHLPMGILKRFRRKGYYNEFRGSFERGIYQTLNDFLSMEFEGFKDQKTALIDNGTNSALATLQVIAKNVLNTMLNLRLNYSLLNRYEKANMRRIFAELGGCVAAMLVAMVLYAGWDDDEIDDSIFKSSCLYLADRLYTETSMYYPLGLQSEIKTMWSSPVAASQGPADFLKGIQLCMQGLFDPDFDPRYTTGRYKGENKFGVLVRRNLPTVRIYDRIMTIGSNNRYYKIGSSNIGMKMAKTFGETLNE